MNDTRVDEQLVADHIAGDRSALAGIYDRYADSLYDTAAAMLGDQHEAADVMQDVFLIAAERLTQLRDGSRLKPWLFAILRNQVYTRTSRRSRTRPTDFSAPGAPEMSTTTDVGAEGGNVEYTELAAMMRSAAQGLDARDQLALEYSIRQDLTGDDLADALGVSLEQSYVVVHRMRERVERALGALTVARTGRKECAQLAEVLVGWDGTFSVLVRKRVARHIESCDVCERTKRRFAVIPMMSAAPAFAAPIGLREQILVRADHGGAVPTTDYTFDTPGGFPRRPPRHRTVLVAAAIALLVIVVMFSVVVVTATRNATVETAPDDPAIEQTVVPTATTNPSTTSPTAVGAPLTTSAVVTDSGSVSVPPTSAESSVPPSSAPLVEPPVALPAPTTPPPAPGRLTVSTTQLDFGTSQSSESVTLANTGGQTITWSVNVVAPFVASPGSGTLVPGQSVMLRFDLNRTGPEGPISVNAAVASTGGGRSVSLLASIDRPPVVSILQHAPATTCPAFGTPTIIARVVDASVASVRLTWSGPGAPGSATMQLSGDWSAPLGVEYVDGAWSYVVTATDTAGNVGTAQGSTTVQCPTPG